MEITLRVVFNSLVKERFEIKNPPVLPNEGDTITFKWEDYLNDQENIRKLREYELNCKFLRANIITKRFSKAEVEVIILLFEESDYLKEEQKNKEVSVYVVPLPDALEVLTPYMKN